LNFDLSIHTGHSAAHAHSGTQGRGSAAWPKLVTVAERVLRTWRGTGLYDTVKDHRRQGLWHIHQHYSGYTLLHPHLNSDGGRGVLTRAAAVLDVEVDKCLQTWTKAPGLGSLATQARHER
jgi:hypothetical protein